MSYLHEDISQKIIKAFYNVYNTLVYSFLEKVYEKAMLIELSKLGLQANNQQAIKVFYDNEIVGEYYADIIVEGKIIIELKAHESLCPEHEVQLINYLKATNIELGLLLILAKKPRLKEKYLLTIENRTLIIQILHDSHKISVYL